MATQMVRANYQEVIDLHTEADHVTIIGIHTPTGNTPRKMFSGFFNQYKKYKYLGASIKLVPAARLPADPLQVSYPPGQVMGTNVDPRDMLNPLMFHGAHGEDMGTVLNRLFGDDIDLSESTNFLDKPTGGSTWEEWLRDALEKVYYKALTDNSWKKANPQRGFMKSGLHPMVYSLATNRQIMPGSKGDVFALGADDEITQELGDPTSEMGADFISDVNKANLEIFTPRLTSLGWLDTRNMLTSENALADATSGDDFDFNQINYALLPKIYMGVIMLPPAYGVEQYFRMIINHNFAFKGFRGISFKPDIGSVPAYYNAEDLNDIEQFGGEDHIDGNILPNEDGGGDDPTPDPDPEPTTASVTVKVDTKAPWSALSGWFATGSSAKEPWTTMIADTSANYNEDGTEHTFTLEPGTYYFVVGTGSVSASNRLQCKMPGQSSYSLMNGRVNSDSGLYCGVSSISWTAVAGQSYNINFKGTGTLSKSNEENEKVMENEL